jgi:hypothetical protein
VLHFGESPAFESARPGVVVRVLESGPLARGATSQDDAAVARVVVEGSHCETFEPTRQALHPVAVRAGEWKTSSEADLAYAGRSLAWWTAKRQVGDGPFELVWVRDAVPGLTPAPRRTRLPALVVRPLGPP